MVGLSFLFTRSVAEWAGPNKTLHGSAQCSLPGALKMSWREEIRARLTVEEGCHAERGHHWVVLMLTAVCKVWDLQT
jgi:hypothetical protein